MWGLTEDPMSVSEGTGITYFRWVKGEPLSLVSEVDHLVRWKDGQLSHRTPQVLSVYL